MEMLLSPKFPINSVRPR